MNRPFQFHECSQYFIGTDYYWSDYRSDYWNGTGYASSNAKLYGGPLDFYAIGLRFPRMLPFGRLCCRKPNI